MKNISERISKAVAGFPEGRMKDTDKPEKATEELWALWREFRPLSLKKEKSEAEKARSEILLLAIAERWRNSAVRESVSKTLRQEIQEREKGILAGLEYDQIRKQRDKNEARRLELFKQIFKSDGVETGELEQIELAELAGEIEVDNQVLEQQEKANPELAARLSFERLRRYQRELAKGFIWTPSRHKYFNELLHRAVVLNQNRPVLIYGESGTGKTRLIREAAKRLSGEPAFEVGEEAKDDIRPLLGKRTIDTEGDYIIYGPLARALIGKQTSRDTKAEAGGVFYMDEMNGYPAGGLRALIKQVSGLKPGDTISFAAWGGKREKVAPGFVFVGSANLLSEKHPDRPDLPNELKRELAPSSFEVDYPPQTAENPEFFEMCLAALMDDNGRVRAVSDELGPTYTETIDIDKNLKTFALNTAKQSGGALWRFANAVAEIQRCYKLTNGAERIDSAPFDPGVAFAWLAEYRKSASRRGESLQVFLSKKLDQWIGGLGGQALFSPQDVKRLKKIVKDFGLMPVEVPSTLFPDKNLTSLEIGRLSPRVSRPPEKIKKAVLPEYQSAFLADGTPIEYQIEVSGKFVPDSVWNKKNQKEKFVFLGKTVAGDLVFGQSGIAEIFTPAEADNLFVPVKTERNPEVFKSPEVKEIIELFGDHFFGPDQIEKAFTIKNEQGQEVKLIDLSPEERQRAVEMLEEKLREPDIKQFLTKPENQKDIKDGKYLLILRVNKIKVNGKNTNLTMKAMQEQIAPDMARNNQGKLLFNTGWYKDEDFYTTATPTFEWTLVTKGVVEATLGKDHPTQTAILTREAQRIGLDPTKIHRRAPCETVFDRILFRTTDFLRDRYDWSDTKSGGLPVGVGGGDSAGLDTSGHSFGNSYSLLGSSLSR